MKQDTSETLASLRLKRGEEKRLKAGHLWVFSNEVDTAQSPMKDLQPGQLVEIQDHHGKALGTGYANPHSLICARLVSRDTRYRLSESLLVHRLNLALSLRERFYATPHYRLIHGDGDGLSGLVVDRFGDTCVVQLTTAGMEAMREEIVTAVQRVVAPRHILLRNDAPIRELEGLGAYVEWVGPEGPAELEILENGGSFRAPAVGGQKTGWYYDHRANRARLGPYVKGRRVLDCFSYVGAWGVQAALAGAEAVTCIDSSADAVAAVEANAALNGVGARVQATMADVFEALKSLREQREKFDVVILDPPAFVKRKKDLKSGLAGYQRLNRLAMQLLETDGMLVSASCSSHVGEADLIRQILAGARHLDRTFQIVETGQQAPDHPIHPALPETRYLKAVFGRVNTAWSLP